MSDLVSIIIPARNEQFLTPTIEDLLRNARGDVEVIAVLEGYWPDKVVDDKRCHYIHNGTPLGMRGAINAGAAIAKGKYLMKCDAHCAFDEGYDVKLAADLEPNWIAVPRRWSLDPETWSCRPKHPIDYMYLCSPTDPNDYGGPSLHGREWREWDNDPAKRDILIDDLMSAQGSCWFMHRAYFYELELEDAANYGDFCFEFQEVGLKCWLSGGRVVTNKKTWYAHLHKGQKYGRGWPLGKGTLDKGAAFTNRWMDGKNWHKQDRDIRWLVNHFWPVPSWREESVRLVFHRRRGDSGEVRGAQVARHFQARLDPREDWHYDFDINIWVKQEPRHLEWPGKHYLDVIDATERIPWLLQHPECGVIAMSQSGQAYLKEVLKRDDVLFIPVHHANFKRVRKEPRDGLKVAGVVGGQGAIQCDVEALTATLAKLGLEFRWLQDYKTVDDIIRFYQEIDVQVVWRTMQRPLKEPLKLVNAMSVGVPTIAYPEPAYQEVDGYYWPVKDFDQLTAAVEELRKGYDAKRLIDLSEHYHINECVKGYKALL